MHWLTTLQPRVYWRREALTQFHIVIYSARGLPPKVFVHRSSREASETPRICRLAHRSLRDSSLMVLVPRTLMNSESITNRPPYAVDPGKTLHITCEDPLEICNPERLSRTSWISQRNFFTAFNMYSLMRGPGRTPRRSKGRNCE